LTGFELNDFGLKSCPGDKPAQEAAGVRVCLHEIDHASVEEAEIRGAWFYPRLGQPRKESVETP